MHSRFAYRFAFNGKEQDNEVSGSGNTIAFEARIYDSRLGRFFSTDPREGDYAWQSTYAYFRNSPISTLDILGMGGGKPDFDKPSTNRKVNKFNRKVDKQMKRTGSTDREAASNTVATNNQNKRWMYTSVKAKTTSSSIGHNCNTNWYSIKGIAQYYDDNESPTKFKTTKEDLDNRTSGTIITTIDEKRCTASGDAGCTETFNYGLNNSSVVPPLGENDILVSTVMITITETTRAIPNQISFTADNIPAVSSFPSTRNMTYGFNDRGSANATFTLTMDPSNVTTTSGGRSWTIPMYQVSQSRIVLRRKPIIRQPNFFSLGTSRWKTSKDASIRYFN